MKYSIQQVFTTLFIVFLLGCNSVVGQEKLDLEPGQFIAVATDQDGASLALEGRAEFVDGILGDGRPRFQVQLISETGNVIFALLEARRPVSDIYPIVESPAMGAIDEFVVSFSKNGKNNRRPTHWHYGGQSGELQLKESTNELVIGAFEIQLYSSLNKDNRYRPLSTNVRIVGQFNAVDHFIH